MWGVRDGQRSTTAFGLPNRVAVLPFAKNLWELSGFVKMYFFLMKGTHVVPSLSVFKAGPNTYLNFASSVIGHHPTRYTPATAKPLKRDHPPPKKYFCCHLFRSYVNFREICFKIYVNQIHRFIQLEGVFFAPRSMISWVGCNLRRCFPKQKWPLFWKCVGGCGYELVIDVYHCNNLTPNATYLSRK